MTEFRKSEELKGCVWNSKLSLKSSTDLESLSLKQEINFDEKLEEAHILIEKVKNALNEIGKGVHNVPDIKRITPTIKEPKPCVEMRALSAPPVYEVCKRKRTEQVKEVKKGSERKVEIENRSKCKKPKECAAMLKEPPIKTKGKKTKRGPEELVEKKDKMVIDIRLDECVCSETKISSEESIESMEMLQEKLKAISEVAESEGKSGDSKSGGLTIPAALMERASSPIDFTPLCLCSSAVQTEIKEALTNVVESKHSTPNLESPKASSQKVSNLKSSKLTIQTMPPVSIHGGFVMQRTLHLCIKPTGSVTNSADFQQNVGYHEINTEDKPQISDGSKIKTTDKSPEDCMDPRTNKGEQILIDVEETSGVIPTQDFPHDGIRGVLHPNDLDEQTFILYKSYQIFDDRSSQRGIPGGNATNHTRPQSVKMAKHYRSPIDMGFYKTQATQCSVVSYPAELETDTKSSLDEQKEDEQNEATILPEKKLERRSDSSSSKSTIASRHSDSDERSSRSSLEPIPESDYALSIKTSSQKSISVQEEEKFQSQNFTIKEDTEHDKPVKESGSSPSSKVYSDVENAKQMNSSDTASIASASSSSSSYNVGGSFSNDADGTSPRVGIVSPQANSGVKRRHSSDSVGNKLLHRDTISETTQEFLEQPVKESEVQERTTSKEIKVDENIQVFLGSSSDEEQVSSDQRIQQAQEGTVESFIKELTGTSQEQVQTFRSTHSFHKNSNLGMLKSPNKNTQEPNSRTPRKSPDEELISSHDYGKSDDESVNLEKQKMKELQHMGSDDQKRTKKDKDKIVMRLQQEAGESCDFLQLTSRRELPFYRRVLGKIIESSNKNPIQKSYSAPTDESFSEGEVKFRNSLSIGEVYNHKAHNKKRKERKEFTSIKRYTEEAHRKEFEDSTSKIAKQREQYNEWITHYLQKQSRVIKDESSSVSFNSSLKK